MTRTRLLLLAPVLLAGCSVMLDTTELAPTGRKPLTATLAAPGEGATGVALDATLSISFSEPMNVGSVTVSTSPSLALGAPAWSAGNTTVSFAPAGLVAQTNYTVNVGGADLAGNAMASAFHFRTLDLPPAVQTTTPSDWATGVPTTTAIQLTFSEAMDPASVQAAFSVSPSITCNWSESTATTATCRPTSVLANSQLYTVTLAATAHDTGGAPLTAPVSFSFTTAAVPHTLAPSIVSSVPDNGVNGVGRSTSIQMTFNEAVDKTTAEQNFGITSPAGYGGGTFTWSADGLTMTYAPPAAFSYGATVSWRMGTGLKCLGGINLTSQVNRSFTVVRQGTVTLNVVGGLWGWMYDNDGSVRFTNPMGVGDTSANHFARAFITFNLSGPSPAAAVPANATAVTSATLVVAVAEIGWSGNPFGGLGSLLAQSVDYGPGLTVADFDTAVLTVFGCKWSCIGFPICRPTCLWGNWSDEYTLLSAAPAAAGDLPAVDVTTKVEAESGGAGDPGQPQPVPAQVRDRHGRRRAHGFQRVRCGGDDAAAQRHLRVPVAAWAAIDGRAPAAAVSRAARRHLEGGP